MFRVKLADLMIEIHNHYDYVKKMCIGYIIEDEKQKEDIVVEATYEQIIKE